jgi:hypothetical protein
MDSEGARMQIVNGYVCQTSCAVTAAKHGHDPKNPHDDPVKAEMLAQAKGVPPSGEASGTKASTAPIAGFSIDAVSFGGALAGFVQSTIAAPAAIQLVDRLA